MLTKIANAARIINLAKEEKGKMTKTEKALGWPRFEMTYFVILAVISGLTLDGIHKRYQGFLKILQKKRSSLAEAMRQYGVPRNTLRDYVGICELKIVDDEKNERVVGCEREKPGKVSVKQIEMCCCETLGNMLVIHQ